MYGIVGIALMLIIPYFIGIYGSSNIEIAQSLCPLKMLTGFPCPGCGITKSFIFLYHGEWLKSLQYHVFGIPFMVVGVFMMGLLAVEMAMKKDYFNHIFYSKRLAYVLGISLGLYHLGRLVVFVYTNNIDEILRQSIWK